MRKSSEVRPSEIESCIVVSDKKEFLRYLRMPGVVVYAAVDIHRDSILSVEVEPENVETKVRLIEVGADGDDSGIYYGVWNPQQNVLEVGNLAVKSHLKDLAVAKGKK